MKQSLSPAKEIHNSGITRRDAIRRTVVFSAAMFTPGWLARLAAEEVPRKFPKGGTHLLAIADFGSANENQARVARAFEKFAMGLPEAPRAVLALGDNFYGPFTMDRFQSGFEDMYRAEYHLQCPFYAALGNHDYEGTDDPNLRKWHLELAYAADNPHSRWKMPAKWYVAEIPGPDGPLIRIIVLDSNIRELSPEELREQGGFLLEQLKTPTQAPWTIVAAHHPIFSNGGHGDTRALVQYWAPELNRANIPLYLCGHDHSMQHIEVEGYASSFVVTGGGGHDLHSVNERHPAPYTSSSFGFTHLHVNDERILVQLLDGDCLHAFTRTRDGSVRTLQNGEYA